MKEPRQDEVQLWKERQEVIKAQEFNDPFIPAIEVDPTPEDKILFRVELS